MAAVEEGQLAHERIEPAVGREQVAQGHGKQGGRPARPDEQGQMGKIPAPDDSLGDLVDMFMICSRERTPLEGRDP